jgi:hypothetical protein
MRYHWNRITEVDHDAQGLVLSVHRVSAVSRWKCQVPVKFSWFSACKSSLDDNSTSKDIYPTNEIPFEPHYRRPWCSGLGLSVHRVSTEIAMKVSSPSENLVIFRMQVKFGRQLHIERHLSNKWDTIGAALPSTMMLRAWFVCSSRFDRDRDESGLVQKSRDFPHVVKFGRQLHIERHLSNKWETIGTGLSLTMMPGLVSLFVHRVSEITMKVSSPIKISWFSACKSSLVENSTSKDIYPTNERPFEPHYRRTHKLRAWLVCTSCFDRDRDESVKSSENLVIFRLQVKFGRQLHIERHLSKKWDTIGTALSSTMMLRAWFVLFIVFRREIATKVSSSSENLVDFPHCKSSLDDNSTSKDIYPTNEIPLEPHYRRPWCQGLVCLYIVFRQRSRWKCQVPWKSRDFRLASQVWTTTPHRKTFIQQMRYHSNRITVDHDAQGLVCLYIVFRQRSRRKCQVQWKSRWFSACKSSLDDNSTSKGIYPTNEIPFEPHYRRPWCSGLGLSVHCVSTEIATKVSSPMKISRFSACKSSLDDNSTSKGIYPTNEIPLEPHYRRPWCQGLVCLYIVFRQRSRWKCQVPWKSRDFPLASQVWTTTPHRKAFIQQMRYHSNRITVDHDVRAWFVCTSCFDRDRDESVKSRENLEIFRMQVKFGRQLHIERHLSNKWDTIRTALPSTMMSGLGLSVHCVSTEIAMKVSSPMKISWFSACKSSLDDNSTSKGIYPTNEIPFEPHYRRPWCQGLVCLFIVFRQRSRWKCQVPWKSRDFPLASQVWTTTPHRKAFIQQMRYHWNRITVDHNAQGLVCLFIVFRQRLRWKCQVQWKSRDFPHASQVWTTTPHRKAFIQQMRYHWNRITVDHDVRAWFVCSLCFDRDHDESVK